MVHNDNFYTSTFANFKSCNAPKRKPDYVSKSRHGSVSSRYWYGQDNNGLYVIRCSDHWGKVATCRWLLNGSTENFKKTQCGKAYYKDFIADSSHYERESLTYDFRISQNWKKENQRRHENRLALAKIRKAQQS